MTPALCKPMFEVVFFPPSWLPPNTFLPTKVIDIKNSPTVLEFINDQLDQKTPHSFTEIRLTESVHINERECPWVKGASSQASSGS